MAKIINGIRIETTDTVTLCGDDVCCPQLKQLADGRFLLTDDNGNTVILTKEQALLISNGVDVLTETSGKEQLICG